MTRRLTDHPERASPYWRSPKREPEPVIAPDPELKELARKLVETYQSRRIRLPQERKLAVMAR